MTRLLIFVIICILIGTSCNSDGRQDFSLTIKHYAGGQGLTIIYVLNEKDLRVSINCDLENCKEKTVYERKLTKNESDSIYNFISSLHLDTLKVSYETKGIMDGLLTTLSFKKGLLSSNFSTFENMHTPTTDTLFIFVDHLILRKKYRFHYWGQDE